MGRNNQELARIKFAEDGGLLPGRTIPPQPKKNPALFRARAFSPADGLAVTYFRMRMHTIIGANPFHGPVRDGKAWVQAAIAARLTLSSPLERTNPPLARAAFRNEVKPR